MLNKDRLHELADIIENVPFVRRGDRPDPHGFNMVRPFFDCGSPACIEGWAYVLYRNEETKWTQVSSELLGITDPSIQCELFCPASKSAYYGAYEGDPNFITPERAANTLRHLAETGIVDWDAPKVDLYKKDRVLENA